MKRGKAVSWLMGKIVQRSFFSKLDERWQISLAQKEQRNQK